jgi:hypothetical protein
MLRLFVGLTIFTDNEINDRAEDKFPSLAKLRKIPALFSSARPVANTDFFVSHSYAFPRITQKNIHLIDRWIVSVTMIIATIKSAFVIIIEQYTFVKSFWQIGIGDE